MAGIVVKGKAVDCYIWDASKECTAEDKLINKVSIGDVGGESSDVDVTSMEDEYKRYENGITDNGTFDLVQFLYTDEYVKMSVYQAESTDIKWALVYRNKAGEVVATQNGAGKVKACKIGNLSQDSAIQVTSTIRIDGAILSDFVEPEAAA